MYDYFDDPGYVSGHIPESEFRRMRREFLSTVLGLLGLAAFAAALVWAVVAASS